MSVGGMGGASESLAYFIKAYDMATPVFRAFGAEVEAVTRRVQASLTEMNKAMEAQTRGVVAGAERENVALKSVSAEQAKVAESSTRSARSQVAASREAEGAARRQGIAARHLGDQSIRMAAETTASFGRSESALTRMGRNMLLVGGAVAAGSLDLVTKFNANTLRMETQAGSTAKQLDQIRHGLLKMAGEVGATPDQLANGMNHVVSSLNAVLPPATRVSQELQVMKIAAEGAQVGHSNLEETTYALASALNALHLHGKDAARVMGELNAIVGSGDMNMQDLVDAFKSGLIPTAREFHISLASIGAAMAVMGDMGMRGALAGTRLRMAISLLGAPSTQATKILETLGMSSDKAAASTKRMSDLLAKAGVHTTRLTEDLAKHNGLQVALQDLDNHLKSSGLSAEGAAAAISRAFGGGRMGAAIALMAENTGRLSSKFDYINTKAGQFGHDWQLTSASFRVQVDKALAALEAFGIGLGEKLLPPAAAALHDLEKMFTWLSKNQTALEILKDTIITFASVAIGSYLITKLRAAVDLMAKFGGGVTSMGKWMLGMGGTTTGTPVVGTGQGIGSTSVIAPGGGGLGGHTISAMTGGIWGINTTQIRVGTLMNPIAVRPVGGAGGLGGGGGGGGGLSTATTGVVPSGPNDNGPSPADQAAATEQTKIAATAAAKAATTAAISQEFIAPGGKFRDPMTGKYISESQAVTRSAIATTPPGVSAVAEMKAEEKRVANLLATMPSQIAYHLTNDRNMPGILDKGLQARSGPRAGGVEILGESIGMSSHNIEGRQPGVWMWGGQKEAAHILAQNMHFNALGAMAEDDYLKEAQAAALQAEKNLAQREANFNAGMISEAEYLAAETEAAAAAIDLQTARAEVAAAKIERTQTGWNQVLRVTVPPTIPTHADWEKHGPGFGTKLDTPIQTVGQSIPPEHIQPVMSWADEEKAIMANTAEAQLMARQMGQANQELSIFTDGAALLDGEMTKTTDQLSLFGVRVAEADSAFGKAATSAVGAAEAADIAAARAARSFGPGPGGGMIPLGPIDPKTGRLTERPGGAQRLGRIDPKTGKPVAFNPTNQAMLDNAMMTEEEILAMEAGSSGGLMPRLRGVGSGLKRFGSNLGGGLMRGGTMFGMGALGAQMIGDSIGGRTGATISSAGTVVSAGAGVGSLVGSVIPIIGPTLGAGIGAAATTAVELAMHLFSHKSYGTQIADGLTKGFGGRSADNLKKDLASTLDDARKQLAGTRDLGMSKGRPAEVKIPITLDPSALSPDKFNRYKADMEKAGHLVAAQLEHGWNQYKFQSEGTMLGQFKAETKKLPPIAQEAALQSAVAFAHKMESQGRLQKGGTKQFIRDIMEQFPALVNYMGLTAASSVDTFTKALDFSHAEDNTKKTLGNIENDFAGVRTAADLTQGGTIDKSAAAIKTLMGIVANSTGSMKRTAIADLAALRGSVVTDFVKMGDTTVAKMGDIKNAVASGSQSAAKSAGKYWGQFVGIVHDAEAAGALTVKEGNKLIAAEMAKALQTLGFTGGQAAKLAKAGYNVGEVSGALAGAAGAGFSNTGNYGSLIIPPNHATGGRVPGAVGPDSWTLMDPSGRVAGMVGGGELLIANRHTERDISAATLEKYNLTAGQMVAGETRSHASSYATGGIISAATGAQVNAATNPAGTAGGAHKNQSNAKLSLPLPRGSSSWSMSVDQGVDVAAPGNTPEYAMAAGTVSSHGIGGFGPWAPILRLDQPISGYSTIYYGHAGPQGLAPVGSHLAAGQQIASIGPGIVGMSTGPHLEVGFGPFPGKGNASAYVMEHILQGLLSGRISSASQVGGAFSNRGGVAAVLAKAWKNINAPQVHGDGAIAAIAQAALDQVTKAANASGQAAVKKWNASNATGFGSAGSTAGLSGGEGQIVAQLAKRFGWTNQIGDWTYVLNRESNGSLTDTNPSSGAYGLAQFINGPSEYYKYGGNPNTMAGQLLAMANYIKSRYGNPSAAAAHERSMNWYSKGGMAKPMMGGGFVAGNPNTDGVPAMLSGNEFVMTGDGQSIMDAEAPGLLDYINSVQAPNFQTGGFLSDASRSTTPAYPGAGVGRGPGGHFVALPGHHSSGGSGGGSGGSHHPPKPYAGYNPFTNRVEFHTTDQWRLIHARWRKHVHDHPKTKKANIHTMANGLVKMYDGVAGSELNHIPHDAQAVASYLDNLGGYTQAKHMFGSRMPVVSISVSPGHDMPNADIYDIESGGKTVSETVPWMKAKIARGETPGAYGGTKQSADRNLNTLSARMSAAGIHRSKYKLWLADWNHSPTVPSGFDAHQYASHHNQWDVSVAKPSFFSGSALGGSAFKYEGAGPAIKDPFFEGYQYGLDPTSATNTPSTLLAAAIKAAQIKAVKVTSAAKASQAAANRANRSNTPSAASSWVRTGATLDSGHGPQAGGAGEFAWHGGMSFAELEATPGFPHYSGGGVKNLLHMSGGRTGLRLGTNIWARRPGSGRGWEISKSDNGDGGGNAPHATVDLHDRIARKLSFNGKEDIEIRKARTGGFVGMRPPRTGATHTPKWMYTPGGTPTSPGVRGPGVQIPNRVTLDRALLGTIPNSLLQVGIATLQEAIKELTFTAVDEGIHTSSVALRNIGKDITNLKDANTNAQVATALTNLNSVLNSAGRLSYRALQNLHDSLEKQVHNIGLVAHHHTKLVRETITRHGHRTSHLVRKHVTTFSHRALTQADHTRIGRLDEALQLVEVQEGIRVGNMVKAAIKQAASISASTTKLQRLMTRQAIATTSVQGANMLQALDDQSVKVLQGSVATLRKAYRLAQKAGDKKVMAAVSDQLISANDQLDQAITDQMTQRVNVIKATAGGLADFSTGLGSRSDLLGALQNLGPGTNLAQLGLGSDVLQTLGLGGGVATGTGMDFLSKAAQNQGGQLTSAQMSQAQTGVAAQNAALKLQENPLVAELQFYQGQLPNLQGQDKADAITAMFGVAKEIATLESTISGNTDALNQLTKATNANTTATGQMTGTVSYQYQGQNYLAGLGLSSEETPNLSVGG